MLQRFFCRKKVYNPRSNFLEFCTLENSGEDAKGREKQTEEFNAANSCG